MKYRHNLSADFLPSALNLHYPGIFSHAFFFSLFLCVPQEFSPGLFLTQDFVSKNVGQFSEAKSRSQRTAAENVAIPSSLKMVLVSVISITSVEPDRYGIFGTDTDIREQVNSGSGHISRYDLHIMSTECGHQTLDKHVIGAGNKLHFKHQCTKQ